MESLRVIDVRELYLKRDLKGMRHYLQKYYDLLKSHMKEKTDFSSNAGLDKL